MPAYFKYFQKVGKVLLTAFLSSIIKVFCGYFFFKNVDKMERDIANL
jgi:hypothetical protein